MCLLLGCFSRSSVAHRGASLAAADLPETAEIAGADVEIGFATGVLRSTVAVQGFRISRHPTTLEESSACVRAGPCQREANRAECGG